MNELFRRLLFLPEQASSVAIEIDTLHYVVISSAVLGAIGVTLAVAILLLRYGEPRPDRDDIEPLHRDRPLPAATDEARAAGVRAQVQRVPLGFELAVVFGLLGFFVALWIAGFRQYVRIETPPNDVPPVYVIAKQWMWSFAYPDGSTSTADLYVPVGRPVRLLMTARDVIHSFYVPAFRVKQDVLPGQMTSLWFQAVRPGSYDILCAEYCGPYHSTMRGRVIVLSLADYERWSRPQLAAPVGAPSAIAGEIASDSAPPEAGFALAQATNLAAVGERVASERGCLRCHTLDGTPHIGPTWAGLYGATVPLEDGRLIRADEAYLTRSMMDPRVEVHAGYQPIMPSYLGHLPAADAAAIVELIRALADRPPAPGAAPLAVPTAGTVSIPTAAASSIPIAPSTPTAPPASREATP